MRISAKRSGGFAGLTEDVGTVDTAQLDAVTKLQVEQMIHNMGFFELPATVSGGIGADLFNYEITVSEGGRQHTVAFTEDGSPQTAPLRRLVDTIAQMRRS
jgi:hypothetical protein